MMTSMAFPDELSPIQDFHGRGPPVSHAHAMSFIYLTGCTFACTRVLNLGFLQYPNIGNHIEMRYHARPKQQTRMFYYLHELS